MGVILANSCTCPVLQGFSLRRQGFMIRLRLLPLPVLDEHPPFQGQRLRLWSGRRCYVIAGSGLFMC